jgi:thiol-disulfide isomerase/thioredoxin
MDDAPIFTSLAMKQLTSDTFDQELDIVKDELVGVFFWGHQCPNCEIAKATLHRHHDEVRALRLRWYHVNTYEDLPLGTRFGLHGIPTFLFFHSGKTLGRISPFPGIEPFVEALTKLRITYPPS